MAGETIGWGAAFWLHNGSALAELAGVFNLTPPNPQADDVEITTYKSSGKRREYIQGMIETGEGTIEMNYVPASVTDALCRAAHAAGDTRAFKIVIPDDAGSPAWEITGNCYVKGYERAIPVDDRITANLTVKFTGAINEAAPA
jgi:predicted secreted protein